MNDRIRQQLRELRIDPDATLQWPYAGSDAAPSRYGGFSQHKLAIAVFAVLTVCTLLSGGIVLLAATHSGHTPTPISPRQPIATNLRFAPLRLEISAPEYRSLVTDGTVPAIEWITLRINAKNESGSVAVLAAGDVTLVDSHGSLFAPTWRDTPDAIRDGFAQPQHTLLALDPLGETQVELVFVVRDEGPFTLRLLHPGELAEAVSVPLSKP